jgi:glycosyltransferase involved in cell wall biosynthesis
VQALWDDVALETCIFQDWFAKSSTPKLCAQEPFGLTLIEAAAHGAPIVATKHGGPVDIVRTL